MVIMKQEEQISCLTEMFPIIREITEEKTALKNRKRIYLCSQLQCHWINNYFSKGTDSQHSGCCAAGLVVLLLFPETSHGEILYTARHQRRAPQHSGLRGTGYSLQLQEFFQDLFLAEDGWVARVEHISGLCSH